MPRRSQRKTMKNKGLYPMARSWIELLRKVLQLTSRSWRPARGLVQLKHSEIERDIRHHSHSQGNSCGVRKPRIARVI
jgi:hypothetical protein